MRMRPRRDWTIMVRISPAGGGYRAQPEVSRLPICPRCNVSVRPLAHVVARRIVIADPDLAFRVGRHAASNGQRRAPHQLRVMPADTEAGVAADVVAAHLIGPGCDHL